LPSETFGFQPGAGNQAAHKQAGGGPRAGEWVFLLGSKGMGL